MHKDTEKNSNQDTSASLSTFVDFITFALYSPGLEQLEPGFAKLIQSDSTERTIMKRILLVVAVVVLYILHQDTVLYILLRLDTWRTPYPLVFGFVPIGLFYHACFAVASSVVMWLLVTFAWPSHLEKEVEHQTHDGEALR
jgi:hypothetical protein